MGLGFQDLRFAKIGVGGSVGGFLVSEGKWVSGYGGLRYRAAIPEA